MNYTASLESPLRNFFFADSNLLRKILLIIGAVCLLAVASQLVIPLRPVPITFQSATVILIAMAYGMRFGGMAIAAYLIAGSAGLPVLAHFSSGLGPFIGPTAGYLFGFLIAGLVCGYLSEQGYGRTHMSAFAIALLGAIIIFAMGIPVLALFTGWQDAFNFGLKPFVITEPVKLFAVSAIIPRLWKPY